MHTLQHRWRRWRNGLLRTQVCACLPIRPSVCLPVCLCACLARITPSPHPHTRTHSHTHTHTHSVTHTLSLTRAVFQAERDQEKFATFARRAALAERADALRTQLKSSQLAVFKVILRCQPTNTTCRPSLWMQVCPQGDVLAANFTVSFLPLQRHQVCNVQ